jgi:hypothetical protein
MGDARRRMEASRAMAVLDEKFIVDDDLRDCGAWSE